MSHQLDPQSAPTTFVCLHGAGGQAADWDLVGAQLRRLGHHVIAVDLPCDQPVGLDAYVNVVLDALADLDGPVALVAQSLSGFVAPLVADRRPVDLLVLVAAMVPRPGESGAAWWVATGHADALAAQGLPEDAELFVEDVPPEVLAAAPAPRDQTSTLFDDPWPLAAWPQVPTRFIACADDRFFPVEWLSAVVRERLGIEPTVVPGGHCAYLSEPEALSAALDACWRDLGHS